MIIGEPAAHESKRRQKLMDREVKDCDHFKHKGSLRPYPQPGHFPIVVDPIIGKTRLSRVLMDDGSGLNLLYADTYDAAMRPSGAPFHEGAMPPDLSYDTLVTKMELH